MSTSPGQPRSRSGTYPYNLRGRGPWPCPGLRPSPRGHGGGGPIASGDACTVAEWSITDVDALSARVDSLVELTSRAMKELGRAFGRVAPTAPRVERDLATPDVAPLQRPETAEEGSLAHLRSLPDGSLGAVFGARLAGQPAPKTPV